jgi:hypothetical protein
MAAELHILFIQLVHPPVAWTQSLLVVQEEPQACVPHWPLFWQFVQPLVAWTQSLLVVQAEPQACVPHWPLFWQFVQLP